MKAKSLIVWSNPNLSIQTADLFAKAMAMDAFSSSSSSSPPGGGAN